MTNPSVPLLDLFAQNQPLKREVLEAVSKLIDSSSFILGQEVMSFEEEIHRYTGVNHAISCASGTDALLLPLMCAGIGPGDEVLVPSFTFYATAASVVRLGATVVFVDSDQSYNICLKDLGKKITKKTKAIIPVHLFGQMVDMEAVNSLASGSASGKIFVIEDCAQSIGAEFSGIQSGAWGDYGAFSFYPTKNLGAMGDAGLVSCREQECADRLKMLRVHGSKQRYFHDLVGFNSRLDSIQAAILRIKLRALKNYELGRAKIAQEYFKTFESFSLEEKIQLPLLEKNRKHVWNQFTIRAKERDALRNFLSEHKIGSEVYYPLPMHRQKAFSQNSRAEGTMEVCGALEKEVLSLPIYPEMPMENVHRVVEHIALFYK